MSYDHMTCVTVMHDITSHPLSNSKIKKNKRKIKYKIEIVTVSLYYYYIS